MKTKVGELDSRFDVVKWLVIVAVVLGGVYANSLYATESLLYRVLAGIVLAIFIVAIALQTANGKAAWSLAKEARVEVRKVVWPNRQETTQTTMIVVFTVIVVAFILWGLDSGLSFIVQGVIG